MDSGWCNKCGALYSRGPHVCYCAPAQEEKEMDKCKECSDRLCLYEIDRGVCQKCINKKEALVAKLERRWDRAFFAALTGLSGIDGLSDDGIVQHAQSIANETIRRHADMMASRDAVIAEVVG